MNLNASALPKLYSLNAIPAPYSAIQLSQKCKLIFLKKWIAESKANNKISVQMRTKTLNVAQ